MKRTFFARGVARHFAVCPYRPYFVMGVGTEQMQAGGGGHNINARTKYALIARTKQTSGIGTLGQMLRLSLGLGVNLLCLKIPHKL